MQLPVLDRQTYSHFNACVHCGLCLQACPTYVETLDEADSPRGRILLMKAIVDGRMTPSDTAFEHLDRCLVCRACEPACPSGVNYHELIEAVRPQVAEAVVGKKRVRSGALRWLIDHVLPYPNRAAAGMRLLKAARLMGLGGLVRRLSPRPLQEMMNLVPASSGAELSATFFAAEGKHRGAVVLLRGCVGSLVSQNVNAACVKVLTRNGFDVRLIREEPCCGALAEHANDPESARAFARRMVDTLEGLNASEAEYFVSPIAGCGTQLKALDRILGRDPVYSQRAKHVVTRIRDITEFLAEVGIAPPTRPLNRQVTYHDPCHLAHAQRVTAAPRRLLSMIPGLQVVPLAESDMCCGAAGTYNLNQPEMAHRLGQRKARRIAATGAAQLVTANVGCSLQIARHLKIEEARGRAMTVAHVVELLAEAYE